MDDRLGVIHDDTAKSAALLDGADRDPLDIAGVENDTVVVQSSAYDGGERYEGLTVDEGDMHALHSV